MNVRASPESWNVYDSHGGEAFMHQGDNASAIKHYDKSIDRNPQNVNGVERLKKPGEL